MLTCHWNNPVKCQIRKYFYSHLYRMKRGSNNFNFQWKCCCSIFTVIQQPGQLPELWQYKQWSCQKVIMLGVEEWQESELDHFSPASRQQEERGETDGPENKNDFNSPALTLFTTLYSKNLPKNVLLIAPVTAGPPSRRGGRKTKHLY